MEPYWLPRISSHTRYTYRCYVYKCALTPAYLVSISRFILFFLFFRSQRFGLESGWVVVFRTHYWLDRNQMVIECSVYALRVCVSEWVCVCVRVDACQRLGDTMRAHRYSDGSWNRCRAQLGSRNAMCVPFSSFCRFHNKNIINDVTIARLRTRTHFIEVLFWIRCAFWWHFPLYAHQFDIPCGFSLFRSPHPMRPHSIPRV